MTLTLSRPIEAEARLRQKNQLTLPQVIAEALGVEPGDDLHLEADPATGIVQLHRVRQSYAGALAGVYGPAGQTQTYLDEEQQAWDDQP